MKTRNWRSNSSSRYAGMRDAVTIEDAVRAAKGINSRVRRERYFASAAARENYLRSLMGLPPTRRLIDDMREGDA
jgi:hypothetical protein